MNQQRTDTYQRVPAGTNYDKLNQAKLVDAQANQSVTRAASLYNGNIPQTIYRQITGDNSPHTHVNEGVMNNSFQPGYKHISNKNMSFARASARTYEQQEPRQGHYIHENVYDSSLKSNFHGGSLQPTPEVASRSPSSNSVQPIKLFQPPKNIQLPIRSIEKKYDNAYQNKVLNRNYTITSTVANQKLNQLREEYRKATSLKNICDNSIKTKAAPLQTKDIRFINNSSVSSPNSPALSCIRPDQLTHSSQNKMNSLRSKNAQSTMRGSFRKTYIRSNSDSNVGNEKLNILARKWDNSTVTPGPRISEKNVNEVHDKISDGRRSQYNSDQQIFPNQSSVYRKNCHYSDTDDVDVSFHRNNIYLPNFSQGGCRVKDDYDFVDYAKGIKNSTKETSGYQSAKHLNLTLRSSDAKTNSPNTRRDIKSSIVVTGDVPSLLKTFHNHDPETKSKCNIKKIREVEKIIRAWEVERVLQHDDNTKVGSVRTLQSSSERTVNRTVSKHQEIRTIGAITQEIENLSLKAAPAQTLPIIHRTDSFVHPNSSHVQRTMNGTQLQRLSPVNLPMTYTRNSHTVSPEISYPALSSRSSAICTSSTSSKPRLNSTTRVPSENFSLPHKHNGNSKQQQTSTPTSPSSSAYSVSYPVPPVRSNSLEGITIDSLMEQLQALS